MNNKCTQLSRFDDETIHKTDYRVPPLEPYVKHCWPSNREARPLLPPPREHEFICPETLTRLRKDKYIPMNMLWRAKPITDRLPDYCKVPKKAVDYKKEEIIRTRPRVYMGMAVSIDDVEDSNDREMLLSYMYNTDAKRTLKEVQHYVQKQGEKKERNCGNIEKATVPCAVKNEGVFLCTRSEIPPIDPNLRKTGHTWDKKQLRATVNSTVHFWTKFYEHPKQAESMYPLIPPETIDRIEHLIDNNKMRLVHEKRCCGYTGYIPAVTTIDVEKVPLPMVHPMHTTNETIYINHFDHANNNFEK